ncbi:hypothetical protein EI94DRAFT_1809256 [Lactarius quietus]|nr:hypothetical protein EI94DRAFT_1809256 [Lactarius quietus]
MSPLNPEVFTQRDFGPSFATSIKPIFPASFQLLLDEGPESGDGVAEGDEDDDDIIFVHRDWTPESSSGVAGDIGASEDHEGRNNLPILAEAVTNHVREDVSLPQPSPSESTISPPSAPPLNQELVLNVSDPRCVPSEEGGESPANPLSVTVASHSASRSSATLQPDWSKSVEEQLADAERSNQQLRHEIDELKTHCYFTGSSVKHLQKQVNTKQTWKGASIHAKNINVDARVLTSEEGRLEVQQLREEATEKAWLQIEALARKATEDQAQRKRRADISCVFTGPLNKARQKEYLQDIAIALSLLDSGKKDDIYSRIMEEFKENPNWRSEPRFEGLFNSRQNRACLGDVPVAGPSTIPPLQPGVQPTSKYLFTFSYPHTHS